MQSLLPQYIWTELSTRYEHLPYALQLKVLCFCRAVGNLIKDACLVSASADFVCVFLLSSTHAASFELKVEETGKQKPELTKHEWDQQKKELGWQTCID